MNTAIPNIKRAGPKCFLSGTPILLPDGTLVPIEKIVVGERVASFEESRGTDGASFGVGYVTRVLPNITTEYIALDDGTRVTPGHRYLRPDGTFLAISDILAIDGLVVDEHAQVRQISGRRIRATDTGSDAEWIAGDLVQVGNAVAQSAPVLGWRTYNFTVERYHTYIAGGLRVHNDCWNEGDVLIEFDPAS